MLLYKASDSASDRVFLPERRTSQTGTIARDENQKESSLDRVVSQVILRNGMLALTPATIDDWNLVSFGEATDSTTEPPSHPHQMREV
jgi:hypothetical protein